MAKNDFGRKNWSALINIMMTLPATGILTKDADKAGQVRAGKLGLNLKCSWSKNTRNWQDQAMQSRLKIPLLFGQDVIHGFRTTFPIPLGETATWDMNFIEKSARIAATEASAYGIHWTLRQWWTLAEIQDGAE